MWTVLLLGALAEGRLWSQTKPKKQARSAPPPESIVSPLDDAVARTASVAAWFRGGPPPRHWTATLPNNYRGGALLGQGTFKKAFSVLNRTDVVLKTRVMHGGARQQTWAEVLYLEFLRGKAGVPKLHGAWQEKRSVYYVVQRLSVPLVENSEPSAAWLKTCRARPREAAVSLIEGVRSFADAGYFDAEHFLDGRKFALSEDGAVYLVDAPEPLATSPVRNVVDWALRGMWKDRNATKDGTCVADKDCPRLREQGRGERVPGHKQAAREAGGWCRNGRCAGIDARAPERIETRSGLSASPKRISISCSTFARAVSTSAFTSAGSFPPRRLNSAQTSVEIVKPGGTGRPRFDISARLAPLPPRRLRIDASPSALPSPKE